MHAGMHAVQAAWLDAVVYAGSATSPMQALEHATGHPNEQAAAVAAAGPCTTQQQQQ
jgi:hypothetical protein